MNEYTCNQTLESDIEHQYKKEKTSCKQVCTFFHLSVRLYFLQQTRYIFRSYCNTNNKLFTTVSLECQEIIVVHQLTVSN